MIFSDLVDHYLSRLDLRTDSHPSQEELLAKVADCITSASTLLSSKVAAADPGTGFEIDIAVDIDGNLVVADVYIHMIGSPPYEVFSVFLEQGFRFLAEDVAFHCSLTVDLKKLES